MSSLLRSCKFVRFLAGITRNISFGNGRQDAFDIGVNHNPNLYRGLAIRALATQQNISIRQESSLDRSLRRIDQDARRAGRVSKKELDEILEEIKQTKSATSSQSLMVIRCCGSLVPEEHPEIRTKLVQEIWNTLESLGVPMDISHYNALLRVYLENGHQFSPAKFLTNLETKGVEPNRVTYQRLVAQHCQEGDMDGAAKVLQIMRDKQMPVNESVFNALVAGHCFNGDLESARGILLVMKQAGLEPSAETYTALLCGHAKQGDIEAIRAVLAESEGLNIEILDRDLMEVVFSLAKAGHLEHVPEVIGMYKKNPGFVQDSINLILRLVNIGHEEIGKRQLELLPVNVRQGQDGPENVPVGLFFIRQLVKSNRPAEKIAAMCDEMEKSNMNNRAFITALETALLQGNIDISISLMEKMKELGIPVRQHYFWPLLASKKNKNSRSIGEILIQMQKVGCPLRGETIRDYVIGSLKGSGVEKMQTLRSCGVPVGTALVSVLISLLDDLKLTEAADLVTKSKAFYPCDTLRRPLAKAFHAETNVEAFVTIVQHIAASKMNVEEGEAPTEGEKERPANSDQMVGALVWEVIASMRGSKGEMLQKILQALVERGLSMNSSTAEKIQELLGAELTPEISNLLSTLTSGSLEPQPVPSNEYNIGEGSMSMENLERLYESLKAKGQPTRIVRKNLLMKYCRLKKLEKAEEIKQSLDAENFVHSAGSCILMMELYANNGKIEEALNMKKQIAERDPDLKMDTSKIVNLAYMLIKDGKFEDGLNMLKEVSNASLDNSNTDRGNFLHQNACWNILNYLATEKDEEKLQKTLECMTENKIVTINNVILGPLIKLKLANDDIPGAMEKFKWSCEQHRATPLKNELTRKLIEAEDAASLQVLTDLSTQVHGEVNSLYDLVFAFVECGRIRQARKILETPGLRSRTFRMDNACERYREVGQSSSLEGLLEATKDLHNIDRSNIFLQLLKVYCKNNETDKALGLWTLSQEENVQPSDEFLILLGQHLQANNMEVPFVVPEEQPKVVYTKQERQPARDRPLPQDRQTPRANVQERAPRESRESTEQQELKQALRRNDLDKALEMKEKLASKNKPMSIRDASQLIENLINADRVGEGFKVAKDMLVEGTTPMSRVFRYLMNKIAAVGDVDGILDIGKHLNDEQKKVVSYDNRLCNAYLFANRTKEYLDQLSSSLQGAKSAEDYANIADKFPRGSALGILEKCPELTEQLSDISKTFAENGHTAPYNVMWMHFFVTGKRDEANEIWTKYLSKSNRIMFQHICQESRKQNDPILCSDLLGLLITTESVSIGAKGNVLSCLLDVLVTNDKFDEALASLQAAHKDIGLEYVNRTALQRLKTGLEAKGKTFPFTIPAKSASQATTTSSSDDD